MRCQPWEGPHLCDYDIFANLRLKLYQGPGHEWPGCWATLTAVKGPVCPLRPFSGWLSVFSHTQLRHYIHWVTGAPSNVTNSTAAAPEPGSFIQYQLSQTIHWRHNKIFLTNVTYLSQNELITHHPIFHDFTTNWYWQCKTRIKKRKRYLDVHK